MMSVVFLILFLMALGLLCLYQGFRKPDRRSVALDSRPRWLRGEGADDLGRGMVIAIGVAFLTICVSVLIISIIQWIKS